MRAQRRASSRGQATVELALVLPVVVTILLVLVQVALLARDQVVTTHAARAAARAVAVDPTTAAARAAVAEVLGGRGRVALDGVTSPGSLVGVTVVVEPVQVPVVGRAVAGVRISERMVARVEGA